MSKYMTYYICESADARPEDIEIEQGIISVLDSEGSPWTKLNEDECEQQAPDVSIYIGIPTTEDPWSMPSEHFRLQIRKPSPFYQDQPNSFHFVQDNNCLAKFAPDRKTFYYQNVIDNTDTPISKGFFSSIAQYYPYNDHFSFGQSIACGLTDFTMVEKFFQEKREKQP